MRISDWSSDVCSSDLRLLAEDDAADRLADESQLVAQVVDLLGESGVGGVIGGEGGRRGHGTASPSSSRGRWADTRWRVATYRSNPVTMSLTYKRARKKLQL